MNKKIEVEETKAKAIRALKQFIRKGTIVYMVLRHVTAWNMTSYISVIAVKKNVPTNLDCEVAQALGWEVIKGEGHLGGIRGVKVHMADNMDMGLHLIHNLSSVLFKGDSHAIKHYWI